MPRSSSPLPWLLIGTLGLAALVAGLWMLMDDGKAPGPGPDLTPPPSSGAPDAPPADVQPIDRPDPGVPVTPSDEESRGALMGRLVNDQGFRVGPARIEAYEGSGIPIPRMRVVTPLNIGVDVDETGEFLIEGLTETNNLALLITGEGFADTESDLYTIGGGEITDVGTVVVERGLRVHGRVLDATERPITGAHVGFYRSGAISTGHGATAPEPEQIKLSDDAGRFEFEYVAEAPFQLMVTADGYAAHIARVHAAVVASAYGEIEFDLRLQPARTISGAVYAKTTGEALSGMTVTALPTGKTTSRGSTISDAEGRFTIQGLMAGDYNVFAEGEDWVADKLHVRKELFGKDDLEIFLEPSGTIRGRVVSPDGELIKRFDVNARWAGGRNSVLGGSQAKDRVRDGEFAFDDMLPGWYSFEVWAPGFAPTRSEPAKLLPGETLNISVPLKPAAGLRGVVVNEDNKPVPGARVSLRMNDYLGIEWLTGDGRDALWFQTTSTDTNGRFELRDVMRGTYQLEVSHRNYAITRRNDVQARPGRVRELDDFVLERAGTLRGVVLDANGSPLPKAEVGIGGRRPDGTSIAGARTICNGKGEYIFRNLQAGTYSVEAWRKETDGFEMLEPIIDQMRARMDGASSMFVDVQAGEVVVHNLGAWDN